MIEIETKFPVDDFAGVIQKLNNLGARCVGSGPENNRFFDTIGQWLDRGGRTLRIQWWNGRVMLCLKKRLERHIEGPFKAREEHETRILDPYAHMSILEGIGIVEVTEDAYTKHRALWKSGDVSIALDTLNDGRKFVEIEMITAGQVDEAAARIVEIAVALGLDLARATEKSYRSLIRKSKKQGLQPMHVVEKT